MSEIYPEIKKHPDCSWGTYFQRIVCRLGPVSLRLEQVHEMFWT
jgi:hypothetical protein